MRAERGVRKEAGRGVRVFPAPPPLRPELQSPPWGCRTPGTWVDRMTGLTGQGKFCLFSEELLPHLPVVWQDLERRPSRQMALDDIETRGLPSRDWFHI